MNYLNFMENRSRKKSSTLRWLGQMLRFVLLELTERLGMKVSGNIGATIERPANTVARAIVGVFNPLPPKGFVVRRAGKGIVEHGVQKLLGRVVAKTEQKISCNLSKDEQVRLMRALALSKAKDRTLIDLTYDQKVFGGFRGLTMIKLSGNGKQRPK